jgi:hypothetical protein
MLPTDVPDTCPDSVEITLAAEIDGTPESNTSTIRKDARVAGFTVNPP